MNVLIINLTRFGDLLQMQPIILGLKAQGHAVGLICLENFAPATVLLRGLDYVYPLSGGVFLRTLAQENAENAPSNVWANAAQHVEALAAHVQAHFPVDTIINTTATLSARLLARRLTFTGVASPSFALDGNAVAKHIPILGFGLDDHGFGESGDMWTTFLQGASGERLNCPFNLVDMFRALSQVVDASPVRGLQKPEAGLTQTAQELLAVEQPENCRGFVAFQLGASEKRRQWPVESFAALGARLWQEEGLCPVLLGSPAENELAKAYADVVAQDDNEQLVHPYINCIGKTDIPHLAAVLMQCTLIVSNDTGTMHLAAGLDVPVMAIFLSTAQAWDTGPYVGNACCLEPALPCHPCPFCRPCAFGESQPCLYSISATLVGDLALHFVRHGQWDMGKNCQQEQVRIWQSGFDEHGFATLRGLSTHENEERTHWLHIQRYFYRHILDNHLSGVQNFQENTLDYAKDTCLKEHVVGLSPSFRSSVAHTLEQCAQLLLLLKEHLQLLQTMPSKQSGPRILSICNTMYGVLEKCPPLKALGHLWLVLFQERGAQYETFSALILSLRAELLRWQATMQ